MKTFFMKTFFTPCFPVSLIFLRSFLTSALLLATVVFCNAQDPQFSQHYANRIYYNPAFTGAMPGLRAAATYRNQWPELPGQFTTYTASVDFQAPCLNSGFGLLLLHDTEGEGGLSTLSVGVSYAYILRIKDRKRERANINFGVSAKYVRKWLPNELLFSDQLDPIHGAVQPTGATVPAGSVNVPDFDAGILSRFRLKHTHNNLGFSIAHLTQPDESLLGLKARLPMRFVAHYSLMVPLGNALNKPKSRFFIMPMFKYEYQNDIMSYNYGLFGLAKVVATTAVYLGVSYQNNTPAFDNYNTNSLTFHAGVNLNLSQTDNTELRIGYSFDANATGLSTAGKGAHELSAIWTFGKRELFPNCDRGPCYRQVYGIEMF